MAIYTYSSTYAYTYQCYKWREAERKKRMKKRKRNERGRGEKRENNTAASVQQATANKYMRSLSVFPYKCRIWHSQGVSDETSSLTFQGSSNFGLRFSGYKGSLSLFFSFSFCPYFLCHLWAHWYTVFWKPHPLTLPALSSWKSAPCPILHERVHFQNVKGKEEHTKPEACFMNHSLSSEWKEAAVRWV